MRDEADAIKANTSSEVYVLSGPKNNVDAERIASEGYVPVLNSALQIELWRPYKDQACALHVDTGMQRLGVNVEDCPNLIVDSFNLCLVMTHLACADVPEHTSNRYQVRQFSRVLPLFPGVPTSIGNSAGTLNGEEFQGDVVRPGIGLYGGNPWLGRPNPLRPVVTCEGVVMQTRRVRKGEPVGYSAAYVAREEIRVATVGLGYADGIPRSVSNRGECAFNGLRMPVIGHISMDATQLDCSNCPELVEGDYVQYFGDTISVDEFARSAGTIPYEILTRLGNRYDFVE